MLPPHGAWVTEAKCGKWPCASQSALDDNIWPTLMGKAINFIEHFRAGRPVSIRDAIPFSPAIYELISVTVLCKTLWVTGVEHECL